MTKIGWRKLAAFALTQVCALGIAAFAVWKVPPAALGDVLVSVVGAMGLTLAYFCGGNVGEHWARRAILRQRGALPVPGESPEGP